MTNNVIELKDIWVSYPEEKEHLLKRILSKKKKEDKFWALKGLNFEVKKGEVLGIIGRNGSGKSTLLKLLTNLIEPDHGNYILRGKNPTLLSLGTGFQPELSGVDNIYLSGLLLGSKKHEIDNKLDEIIEYSELGDFVYKPIRTYSSGMKARLGFSVAITLDPDVLLIDEVLGVGDQSFMDKSKATITEKIQSNRTVILVSHSAQLIRNMCDRVVWLNRGQQIEVGITSDVIPKYLEYMKGNPK